MKKINQRIIKWKANENKLAGFTLIEMVVVIAIVVMLLIIIAPNLVQQKNKAQTKTDAAFATTLQTQVELYNDDHPRNKLKNSLEPLKDGNQYLTSDQKKKISKYELNSEGKVVLRK